MARTSRSRSTTWISACRSWCRAATTACCGITTRSRDFGNPKPYGFASRDLKIRDAAGKEGGFTARYSIDGQLKLERVEKDINYQYIRDRFNWPKELLVPKEPPTGAPPNILPNQTVTWEGSVESPLAGQHKFQLYGSSYFKVFVDGKLVLDRWRQNWAAWYQNFDVTMEAGKPRRCAHRMDSAGRLHRAAAQRSAAGCGAPLAHLHLGVGPRHRLLLRRRRLAGRGHRRLPAAHRQGGDAAALGLWLLAEPPALQHAGGVARRGAPSTASARSRSTTSCRTGSTGTRTPGARTTSTPDALPRSEGDGRRGPRAERAPHDLGVAEVLSDHGQLQGTRRSRVHVPQATSRRGCSTGWARATSPRSTIRTRSPRATCTGARSTTSSACWASMPGGWMPPSRIRIRTWTSTRIKARIGPTALGSSTDYFNTYALVHSGGVYEGARAARPGQARVHPHALGLRRHPAQRGRGLERRHRLALGRPAQPDLRGRERRLRRACPTGRSTSAASPTKRATARRSPQPPTSKSGASSTCAGSSSAPSRRCSARTASSRCARSTTSRRRASEVYESLVWHDKLRYRLLPYIYTVAADTYHRDGTIMRGLAMDFADDAATHEVRDQYLFGKAFLVAPVYQFKARERAGLSTGGRRLVRLPHRREARGWPDGEGRGAAQPHAAVRARRIHRAGGSGDPVHGRETGRTDHAVRVHRQRRRVRSVRGRRRELWLRERRVRAHSAAVTTRRRARSPSARAPAATPACPRSAHSRCAGSSLVQRRPPTWMPPPMSASSTRAPRSLVGP